MRQIVLDTETTGIEVSQGHRIIEIGAVELVNRRHTGRHFHRYLNPERDVEAGAFEVHGISDEFLADKPLFARVADEFLAFVRGAQLVIHNAPFDVGFLNNEFGLLGKDYRRIQDSCSIIDTLAMARQLHPGQRNSLDALCKRYLVDNSQRDLHGALLDAEILAEVYLLMTGGQVNLALKGKGESGGGAGSTGIRRVSTERPALPVTQPEAGELVAHRALLERIVSQSGRCLWSEEPQAR